MTKKIDSLTAQLAQAEGQQKIDLLNELACEVRDHEPQRALALSEEAYALAQQGLFESAPYKLGLAHSMANLGYLHHYKANYGEALLYGQKALALYEALNHLEGLPITLYIIGLCYLRLGNYAEALPYQLRALEVAQNIGHLAGQAKALNGIAIVYVWSGQHNRALTYFERSLQLHRQLDDPLGQVVALMNLCMSYRDLGKYEDSLAHGLACLQLCQKIDNRSRHAMALDNLGNTYVALQDYATGLTCFHQAIDLMAQVDDKYVHAAILLHTGRAYYQSQQPEPAKSYLLQALTIATESEQKGFQFECHQALAQLYQDQRDFEQALAHYQQFHTLKEAVFNAEADGKLKNLEILQRTETARQEAEIYQLKNVALEQEIAERKHAEAALRESEARFRAIVEGMPIPIIIGREADGAILYANTLAGQLLGLESEALIGRKALEFYANPQDRQDLMALLQQQGQVCDYEFQVKTTGGSLRWISDTVQRIVFKGEQVLLSGFFDITERKEISKQLQTYAERLEEMVQERTRQLEAAQERLLRQEKLAFLGQLAGGVGHELRNPLGVITNAIYFLQTLLTGADETVKEYLDLIAGRVQEADKIVADLLNLSRNRTVEKAQVTARQLTNEVLTRQPAPDGVTVTVDLPPNLPVLFVDPQQIRQVLINLITNAYQAMPNGGELMLSARAQGNQVKLNVADTGIGISPEAQAKIFEPLFTTKAKGIGLGLAVSKNLIEVNGGTINVESTEGQGSTFSITLPAKNLPG